MPVRAGSPLHGNRRLLTARALQYFHLSFAPRRQPRVACSVTSVCLELLGETSSGTGERTAYCVARQGVCDYVDATPLRSEAALRRL